MDNIEELIELVLQYLRGIWKQRWLAIIVAWPVMIAGVIAVDTLTDKYTATTRVYIDSSSVLKPLLKGIAVESNFKSNVKLMSQRLLSRPNLERALRQLDLDIQVTNNLEMEKLINKILKNTELTTSGRSNSYTISYINKDPAIALKMVQTLLDIFIEDTLGNNSKESDLAITFLDNQINKYDLLLSQAETRVENFKRKNIGIMPQDGASYFVELKTSTATLEKAKLEHLELKNRKEQLSIQLSALPTLTTELATFKSKYQTRINQLEIDIDEMLLLYTIEHPDVISKTRILDSLTAKKGLEEIEFKKNATDVKQFVSKDPVRQQISISLSETVAQMSSLKARINAYSKKQQTLKKRVDIIPKIEAELTRLNRDYRIHKTNYEALVTRREKAKIKFKIVEPPNVPSAPNFPNRPLFDIIVLIFALMVGYGIGLLKSLLQPVFYNAPQLAKFTNLAILGAINKIDTVSVIATRKRNIALFFLANILLILTNVVFIIAHMNGILLINALRSLGINL